MRRYASLRGRREFAAVIRRGAAASAKDLILFVLASSLGPSRRSARARVHAAHDARTRVGIIITKKVGTAVERNRLRRRCKSLLDTLPMPQPPVWCVVQFRACAATASFEQLREQLTALWRGLKQPAGRRRGFVETARA